MIKAPDFSAAGRPHDAHHDGFIAVLRLAAPPVDADMIVMGDYVLPEDEHITDPDAVLDLCPMPALYKTRGVGDIDFITDGHARPSCQGASKP